MDEGEKTANIQSNHPPPAPTSEPKPVNTAIDEPTPEEQLANAEKQMSRFEKSTLQLAIAAVIMSALAAVFVCLQWIVMEQTLSEMKRSGNTATDQLWQAIGNMNWMAHIADGSLHQAQKSLDTTIEQDRMDQRAWVVIDSIEKTATFPPNPPFGTIFKFSIFPKNVGKTVARDVRIHSENPDASASFMENRHAILMSEDQLFHLSGTNKRAVMPDNPGPQALAPKAQSPVPVFSGGQEPKRYSDGQFRYSFILGRIDYTDAFGVSHWTHFCYFISNSRGELANCKYGNDQDSNGEKVPVKPN